jgi:hypothetical protein
LEPIPLNQKITRKQADAIIERDPVFDTLEGFVREVSEGYVYKCSEGLVCITYAGRFMLYEEGRGIYMPTPW